MSGKEVSFDQHAIEINANGESWNKKPILKQIYAELYQQIAENLADRSIGPRVEIGSGIGSIKQFIPDCITTDVFSHAWLDRQENAYALSFADNSVGSLILFDVWHHLKYPGTILREFHRVLAPGGRVIIMDPAVSMAGRVIYGIFHHEPIAMRQPITWFAPVEFQAAHQGYYAAQGNAWRMFAKNKLPKEIKGWELRRVDLQANFRYCASGGFSGPQLYPSPAYRILRIIDRMLSFFPRLFATRMLVVLEKSS